MKGRYKEFGSRNAECGSWNAEWKSIAHSVKGEKVSAPPLAAEAASLIEKKL